MDMLLYKAIRIILFWNLILGGGLYTFLVTYGATMRRHGETPSLLSILTSANATAMAIGAIITLIGIALFIREFRTAL